MRFANRSTTRVSRAAMVTVASGVIAAGAVAVVMSASASPGHAAGMPGAAGMTGAHTTAARTAYSFRTVDDAADLTFNQLLGINNEGVIAGYFGSGAQGHPNMGYRLTAAGFQPENVPGSVQTQVTGLNDAGVTVGFSASMNNASLVNDNHGFVDVGGTFRTADFPAGAPASPPVDQLLGVNDHDVAVGFYTDAKGNNHGYEYDISRGRFSRVTDPGQPGASLTAAAIDNRGDVAGFYTGAGGKTDAFELTAGGQFMTLADPGASATQAFGINDHGEVVGAYTDGAGKSASTHGFTWTAAGGFSTVDDPQGIGTTTVNGVNDHGDLVGFYTDARGNTDGLIATPLVPSVTHLQLQAMPHGTASFVWTASGQLTLQVSAFGFTPGSSHLVQVTSAQGTPVAQFSPLTANSAGQVQQTLDSTDMTSVPVGSHLVIQDPGGAIAGLPVAQTAAIAAGQLSYPLQAVEDGPTGTSYGTPQGQATVAYDPAARTITVTLTASGLTPGAHAAHIHLGSCASQGPVQYMLMDFTADSHGRITHQVRTVTGVTAPLPATGWYLNLHQGTSSNIVAGGQPTVNFRPLLCAGI